MPQRWEPKTPRDRLVLEVMEAVRAFSDSMDHMYGGIRGQMDMNATDLAALRMLIIREQRDELVKPADIAAHLAISTASTKAQNARSVACVAMSDAEARRSRIALRPRVPLTEIRGFPMTSLNRRDGARLLTRRLRRYCWTSRRARGTAP